MKACLLLLTPLFSSLLLATTGGGPYAHTGAFGEGNCNDAGCHRNTLGGTGSVTIDVGPYVPGQKQRVRVTINDAGARAWGFQLAARETRNLQRQAGAFTVPENYNFVWIHCADGTVKRDQPCNNQLEYVTHTSVGTRLGTPAGLTGVTFIIDWTSPSSDVGDIAFSVAALGADGDLGTNGDRTYNTTFTSLYAPSNQPTLDDGGVVNAAGFARGRPISSGTIVSLFGKKLAPPNFRREVTRSDLTTNQRLPIELQRISADFLVAGTDPAPGYVLFVSDTQLNVQVPALPSGAAKVDVQPVFNRGQGANEIRGNRVTVNVQNVSPGLFTFSDGVSVAAVTASGAPVGRAGLFANSRPARPGDVILVFGTGYGPTSPVVDPGALAPDGPVSLTAPIAARIGNLFLTGSDILYAGAAPSFAGLQQFNIRIPAGVASGDQPIVISAGGIESQSTAILTVQQ